MAGFIIWLVIIFAVVAINRRGTRIRSSGGLKGPGSSFGTQRTASSPGKAAAAGAVKREQNSWSSAQQSDESGKQQALKERLAKKYNRPASGDGDILSRAKASVEEDFGQTWEQEEQQRRRQQEQKRQAKEQQERQRQKEIQAYRRQEQQKQQMQQRRRKEQQTAVEWPRNTAVMHAKELERHTQEMLLDGGLSVDPRRFMGQDENLDLDAVWDLMVKGPNLDLTFERDFIAEGVEMLNRIQA